MCSIDISRFNLLDHNKNVLFHSSIDDQVKTLLIKSIKKRKQLMDLGSHADESFFMYPRKPIAAQQALMLAENCTRAITLNKLLFDPFLMGYLNFLSLQYVNKRQKEELISCCHTWITQALTDRKYTNDVQFAQSHYIRLVTLLSIGKNKELQDTYASFSNMMEKLPPEKPGSGINSPHFWYQKAEMVWEKEIQKKNEAVLV